MSKGRKGHVLSSPPTSVTIHFFSKTAVSGEVSSSGCGCIISSKVESWAHDGVGVKERVGVGESASMKKETV
jgi:hypothetical protein